MYKVLIADDEILLRFAVVNLINWEEAGFTIIGEAGDGAETLKMARTTYPDLIITDIRMPKMDGLEMVRQLRKESTASVIILSNYDDFQYAQQALRLGVDDYVLKSALSKEMLLTILQRIKSQFDFYHRQNALSEQEKKEMPEDVLRHVIQNRGIWTSGSTEERDKLSFLNTPYRVILLRKVQSRQHKTETEATILTTNQFIKSMISSRLKQKGHYFLIDNGECLIMLSEQEYHSLGEEQFWKGIVEMFRKYTNTPYVVGISNMGKGIDAFYQQYQESLSAVDRYFFSQENQIFTQKVFDSLSSDRMRSLLTKFYMQAGEMNWVNDMRKTLSDMLEVCVDANISAEHCKTIFYNSEMFYLTKTMSVHDSSADSFQKWIGESIRNSSCYEELKIAVVEFISIMDRKLTERSNYSAIVQEAIAYIHEHYSEHVSLVSAAQNMSIHPNHLSRIFSKQTGQSFNKYLNVYRLEKAKDLLLDRTLTIQEVGERVGIPEAKYFSNVFKKWCDLSPREYRQKSVKP